MVTNRQPFVSIVTPVHNTGEYLASCIESVLFQSYSNWEYVIVNNRSTDDSLAIAEKYAADDNRIRIVNTAALLPQLVNYNFALRQIAYNSKYCKVVQADDWLYRDCLQAMVEVAETDSRIAIVRGYTMTATWVSGLGLPCGDSPRGTTSVISGRDACRMYLLADCYSYLFGTPTAVLYRSDLVRSRGSFYVEDSQHGDSEACLDLLDGHLFAFIHQILNYGRLRRTSISGRIADYNPLQLQKYIAVKKYGRRYLTLEEYEECLHRDRKALYVALARNLFRRRGKEYWEFQRWWLSKVGEKLEWKSLYWLQLPRILNMMGNPKTTCERLLGYLSRSEGRRTT